ncbi:MAG: hypothetical protein ACI9LM_003863 [Alteromonadaceae bacterium]|jgi:hypothetical protein
MEFYPGLLWAFLPWVIVFILALIASKLMKSAKKRQGSAVAFGALVQMLTPDPYAERTIEMMVVEKKQIKKQEEGTGELPSKK